MWLKEGDYEKGKVKGAHEERERIVRVVEDYFKGLIIIPDPQATGKQILAVIQEPKE